MGMQVEPGGQTGREALDLKYFESFPSHCQRLMSAPVNCNQIIHRSYFQLICAAEPALADEFSSC